MALSTPTLHINESSTTGVTAYTTASFTPSANALLLVFASTGSFVQRGPLTVSSTFTGTWTNIQQNHPTGIWTAVLGYMQLGASPGSGTVTVTAQGGSANKWVVQVVEIASGFNTTTPIAQSKVGTATTGTTFSLTLDSTPAAGSHVYGMISTRFEDDGAITPGTQFTEIADRNAGGAGLANSNQAQSQYDATSPGTIVDWSGLGTSITEIIGIAVEVAAGASSGTHDLTAVAIATGTPDVETPTLRLTGFYWALDEDPYSDIDYVGHTAPQVGDYFEVGLSDPDGTPDINAGDVTLYWRAYDAQATAGCEVTVELREGTTVIANDVETLTGTVTLYSLTLSEVEKGNITDWSNLRLRATITAVP